MELSYSSTDIALLRMVTRNIKAVPDRLIMVLIDHHLTFRGLTGCFFQRWVQSQNFALITRKDDIQGIAPMRSLKTRDEIKVLDVVYLGVALKASCNNCIIPLPRYAQQL